MSPSQPNPVYVYKLLPIPNMPADFPFAPPPPSFPITSEQYPLDKSDGFIHLCTYTQISGVISRFLSSFDRIWLLQIRYKDEDAGHVDKNLMKWEGPVGGKKGEDDGELFPHLYPPGVIKGGRWALWEKKESGGKGVVLGEEDDVWK